MKLRVRTHRGGCKRGLWGLGCILSLASISAVGCDACGDDAVIAELAAVNGEGEVSRDFAASQESWSQATVGDEFVIGDGVKTWANATATVELVGGGQIQLTENSIVRFRRHAGGGERSQLAVELGEATFTAGSEGLSLIGDFGEAVLEANAQVRINAQSREIQLEVGGARIEQEGGSLDLVVGEAQSFDLDIGEAVLEAADAGAEADIDAGPPDAGVVADAGPPVGMMNVSIRGRRIQIQNEDGEWERADPGTSEIPAGARVRLGRRDRLTIRRNEESATIIGPAEAVIGSGGGALASLSSGRASTEAGGQDTIINVPGGAVITRGGSGSRGDIRMRGSSAIADARRGTIQLRGSAQSGVIRTGETATLRGDGTIESTSMAPGRAHIALRAGASATIHDPGAPTAVRIRFGDRCPGEAVVEVARGRSFRRPSMRSFGTGSANILVQPGSNSYRVRCSSEGTPTENVVAQGSLSVRRDSGRGQLPRRPTRAPPVDADGRPYTMLYQNLLPIVTFRWPDAPEGGGYTLNIQPQRGQARQIRTSSARHTLESGEVPEGTHRFWFEGGGRRSQTSTLTIRYDNAASAIDLREPGTGTLSPGGSVRVSGVALEGATISAGGVSLPLDRQFRFSGDVPVPSDVDALAIRVVHPRSGVHYYLRRTR